MSDVQPSLRPWSVRAWAGVWLAVGAILGPVALFFGTMTLSTVLAVVRPSAFDEALVVDADTQAPGRIDEAVDPFAEWAVRVHPDDWAAMDPAARHDALSTLDIAVGSQRVGPGSGWRDASDGEDDMPPVRPIGLAGSRSTLTVFAPEGVRVQALPRRMQPFWLSGLFGLVFDACVDLVLVFPPLGVLMGAAWLAVFPVGWVPRARAAAGAGDAAPRPPPRRQGWRDDVPAPMRRRHFKAAVLAAVGAAVAATTYGPSLVFGMLLPAVLWLDDPELRAVVLPLAAFLFVAQVIGFGLIVEGCYLARPAVHAPRGRSHYAGAVAMLIAAGMAVLNVGTSVVSLPFLAWSESDPPAEVGSPPAAPPPPG
ncbi:MAG: hypothetical protein H6742_19690 [Alphaproteobacteria bacterium]|nr:hypothetical protein [Alphaproteobacteria bacterium]